MIRWLRRRLRTRQQRAADRERVLRDILLPTIRAHSGRHNLVLSDADEEKLMQALLALHDPKLDMKTFSARVRERLKQEQP